MKRILAITLLCIALVGCNMSCSSFKVNEQSGKTDATVQYYSEWLTGAQFLCPLFGPYMPEAQVAISLALTALDLYSKASDMYASGKLNASQLAASLVQVQEAVSKIVALGNKAGVK
jgi:transcription elongation factor Elf1